MNIQTNWEKRQRDGLIIMKNYIRVLYNYDYIKPILSN